MQQLTIKYDGDKVKDFGKGQLIQADINGTEFLLVAYPVESMMAMKEHLDAESGEMIPSKGFLATISSPSKEGYGPMFSDNWAVQLTVMKFNNSTSKIKRAF